MKNKKPQTAREYMALPYRIELIHDGDAVVASVAELPFCISQGPTETEALARLCDAMEGWLEVSIEYGDEIPLPYAVTEQSGVTTVRLGKTLHRRLREQAERDGVSLNHHIVSLLNQYSSDWEWRRQVRSAVAEGFEDVTMIAAVDPQTSVSKLDLATQEQRDEVAN
jgi:antitoxin HicB